MRCWSGAVLAIVLAACGDEGGAPRDGGATNDAGRSCAQLKDDYNAVLESLDRACDDVGDCLLVGEVTDCHASEPHLATNCGGAPVQRAAFEAARDTTLAPILAAMTAADCFSEERGCDELGCTFDCSPSDLHCSDTGQCSATPTEYCWENADAGP
jgi:hypothetical protein